MLVPVSPVLVPLVAVLVSVSPMSAVVELVSASPVLVFVSPVLVLASSVLAGWSGTHMPAWQAPPSHGVSSAASASAGQATASPLHTSGASHASAPGRHTVSAASVPHRPSRAAPAATLAVRRATSPWPAASTARLPAKSSPAPPRYVLHTRWPAASKRTTARSL